MAGKSKKITLMEQFYSIKKQYPDTLLLFGVGDFFELFEEDARIASKELGIALTARNHGLETKTPLAGVPHHSLDKYLSQLLKKGFKVAICEQIEDPKFAKGLVKRDVIEVMTPGTITVASSAEDGKNQYLLGLFSVKGSYFICAVDVLSGEFFTVIADEKRFLDELAVLEPSEFLVPDDISESIFKSIKGRFPNIRISLFEPWNFEFEHAKRVLKDHFGTSTLEGFGDLTRGEICIAGGVLAYLNSLKKGKLTHIKALKQEHSGHLMHLDESTIRNLELIASMSDGKKYGTLLWFLDETKTPMGARLLRRMILSPLTDEKLIMGRLSAVDSLIQSGKLLGILQEYLANLCDLERIAGRIGNMKANPRDLTAVEKSLRIIERIRELEIFTSELLQKLLKNLNPLPEIRKRIKETIVDNPPPIITNGGIIRPGVIEELDELRELRVNSRSVLMEMEVNLRNRTCLDKLKIKSNKVFGYFIEIPRMQAKKAPPDFIRKQTLVNAERFITPELKELESKILAAEERINYIEREFYLSVLTEISIYASKISDVARAAAWLDVLSNFANIAMRKKLTKPEIAKDGTLEIKSGWHPVLWEILGKSLFVPNDLNFDNETQIIVLTGPNMAGKSTYLRQNGLIMLMAQIGSFVPADYAKITPVDRIFTRVGAVDYIAKGQSTFLVEMLETANILHNATDNSLVLLDEIGRGTSTYDGLSIAWAVVEYIHTLVGHKPKTIFATHYHELTEVANYLSRVKNFQISVREKNEKIVFLHKIVSGGCDDSYGIHVAQLAGVPEEVIQRSKEILDFLEAGDTPGRSVKKIDGKKPRIEKHSGYQISLFDPEFHPLVVALKDLDVNNLTPLQALELISKWRENWE